MSKPLNTLDRMRLACGAEHLHQLGARSVAELLADLTARAGGGAALFELLVKHERRVPAIVRSADPGRTLARHQPRTVPVADPARVTL